MKAPYLCLIIFFIALSGCGKKNEGSAGANFDQDFARVVLSLGADRDTGDLPPLALTLTAQLDILNFLQSEEEKINQAVEIIRLVVGTQEFRRRILNHTFEGKKIFVDNRNLTNQEIYQKILDGAERLSPNRNNRIDAEVELYYESANVVGYTYPNSKRIWVNRKYFSTFTPAGVAHNLFHEWLHKLGFDHAANWSIARDYSVPYAVGNIVGDIGKDFL